MLLGKVVIHLQKTEIRSMFITVYYYQLKMDQGPSCQAQNTEINIGKSKEFSGRNRYMQGLPE
jgi:hypothetical protein